MGLLILGHRGQVGTDICHFLETHHLTYHTIAELIDSESKVEEIAKDYRHALVVNCAFDKSLKDQFTNLSLPILLEQHFSYPVHLSSNAVYGVKQRTVSVNASLDPFNPYAQAKIKVENALTRSRIIRGSFLCTGNRIFKNAQSEIHKKALWNGITGFEFGRLLTEDRFKCSINNVASEKVINWNDLTTFFKCDAHHNESLLENKCILTSSVEGVADLADQLENLKRHIESNLAA